MTICYDELVIHKNEEMIIILRWTFELTEKESIHGDSWNNTILSQISLQVSQMEKDGQYKLDFKQHWFLSK